MRNRILSAILILAFPLAACATEYRTVDRPRQECWNERVPVQSAGSGYGGALLAASPAAFLEIKSAAVTERRWLPRLARQRVRW
jgi:hypothetical protein